MGSKLPLSPKHAAFAERVASGEAASKAYTAVYGVSGATAEASASRLLRNAKVAGRICALQGEAAESAGIERAEAIAFLVAIVRTSAGELHPGHPLCQAFRETGSGAGRTLYVQMPSKLDAVDKLAKLCGWYAAEKHDVAGKVNGKLEVVIRKL